MMFKLTLMTFLAASLAVMLAPSARAQHGGDVLLTVEGGMIRTGSISEDGSTIIPGVRVFESRLGEASPGFGSEPGFDNLPGTFAVPSTITFRIRKALRWWTGVAFAPVPERTLSVAFGPIGPVVTPATDTVVTGFPLGVGSNGEWHKHLEYTLSPLAPPQSDGVYLLELSLFSSRPEAGESRPFWLVFGLDAPDADVDDAVRWVRSNLACVADFNGDGTVSVQDIFDFLSAYFAALPAADVNLSGGVTVQDVFDYLSSYFMGCS